MTELGVNEHHHNQIVNYLRFWRYQRNQRLRSVVAAFEDVKSCQLNTGDTTFTIDEVEAIMEQLLQGVKGEMNSELINTGHTNILLLRQLFQQSEKWHLRLSANISELENKEILDQIKDFEECEFAGIKVDKDLDSIIKSSRLEPLNETGSTALLHTRIEELQGENQQLISMLKQVQAQHDELKQLKSQAPKAEPVTVTPKGDAVPDRSKEVDELQKKIGLLLTQVDTTNKSAKESEKALLDQVAAAKHELLKVQETMQLAEKELERKVQDTAPFKNMKQMLVKKNDQIKELRGKLEKFDPESG